MPIRPEFLVRGLDGRPLPPQDLLDRLKQYDERIGLFYTNASWAITESWREDDPRRIRIQQREMQPEYAFDICGYLPITCSLDEALPYIERELRNHTAESFAALRYAALHWNEVTQPAALEDQMMGAMDNDLGSVVGSVGIVNVPVNVAADITPPPVDRMAAARAAKAAKAVKAAKRAKSA